MARLQAAAAAAAHREVVAGASAAAALVAWQRGLAPRLGQLVSLAVGAL